MPEPQATSGNKGECIRTLCRFRPLNAREKALQGGTGADTAYAMTLGDDGRSVWLGADKSGGQFTLDAMLGPDATQQDAYDQISAILNGADTLCGPQSSRPRVYTPFVPRCDIRHGARRFVVVGGVGVGVVFYTTLADEPAVNR